MPEHKPKILIVDDRPENLVALEKLLNGFQVEFIRASSGNEAITLTFLHRFALAIIDIQMPEMDGYETVELLRQEESTKLLPV
ncbi:MAG: response regulator, partial [Bacteroidia bacterium]|nr:response regulator [Sphingobacteriia bacterium]NCD42896.1 response regulator [Bacteroidia bacterium]